MMNYWITRLLNDKFFQEVMVKPKVVIVMPAFNEENMVGRVIKAVKKRGFNNIIVVDDGSKDNTTEVSLNAGADVVVHPLNRGLGAALGTGIQEGVTRGYDIIVTFDSDGQHHPDDIEKVISPIAKMRADAVIGTRLKNPRGMPIIRRIGNWGFNVITYMLFGVWTTDSQSGFRAFSKKGASVIDIKSNRMEVSSEIIKEIGRNKLKFREVPIRAIYTDYSMSRGQSSLNAFRILAKLILRRLKR